jgi:hypothetical protein
MADEFDKYLTPPKAATKSATAGLKPAPHADLQPQSYWDYLKSRSTPTSALDFTKGLGETLMQHVASANDLMHRIPVIGNHLTSDAETKYYQDLANPANEDQKIGKGTGNAAEWAIPGGAEEELAAKGASVLPKVLRILPKVAVKATTGAITNKLQGGSATTGALVGGGGELVSPIIKAGAKPLFGGAFNLAKDATGYGADPLKSITEHTGPSWKNPFSGLTLESSKDQLQKVINKAGADNAQMALGEHVDLDPAEKAAQKYISRLRYQGLDTAADAVHKQVLTPLQDVTSGNTALGSTDANQAMGLRTGFGTKSTYNSLRPDPEEVSIAAKSVNREISNALHNIPQYGGDIAANDATIHSGIPVIEGAQRQAGAPSFGSSFFKKAGTGAFLGASTGAFKGYKSGDNPADMAADVAKDAILGGIVGATASNPTAQLLAARAVEGAGNFAPQAAGMLLGANNADQPFSVKGENLPPQSALPPVMSPEAEAASQAAQSARDQDDDFSRYLTKK